MTKLKKEAQTKEFGLFLSDANMNQVNDDYYHLLKTHINNGSKNSIKNVFRFFHRIVHYEDTGSEIEECRSNNRRESRINELNVSKNNEKTTENAFDEEPNIWQLKQYYHQSQLDIIHYHLVHSNWKLYIQRFSNQKIEDEDYIFEKHKSLKDWKEKGLGNKMKYVTDLRESKESNYGFGVDHSYPHLSPIYGSIQDELLFNRLCSLKHQAFTNLLVKSIKLHRIATGPEYKHELICKYFNKEYNIIRNQLIGLR
eukprot:144595_1